MPPADRIRAALEERGIAVSDDELEELVAADAALRSWIERVERLAQGWPAFSGPMP